MSYFTGRSVVFALLLVTSAACHDPDRYLPGTPTTLEGTSIDSILNLSADVPSLPADGGSRTRIEARIDPAARHRAVMFTTSAGTLFAAGRSAAAPSGTGGTTESLEVNADSDGIAAAELQSAALPGTARVTASLRVPATTVGTVTTPERTFTRSVDVSFVATAASDVISITATPSGAEADGATLIHVVATVSVPVAGANRQVEFTASNGQFASGTQNGAIRRAIVDLHGTSAEVDLIAPETTGPVTITAAVAGFTAQTQVVFNRARPETIFVTTAQSAVSKATGSVRVTALLFRDVGRVATNTIVTYTARDAAGNPIGSFFQVTPATGDGANGEANRQLTSTAEFDPDNTAVSGPATITATAGGRSGSVTVTVTD